MIMSLIYINEYVTTNGFVASSLHPQLIILLSSADFIAY